MLQGQNNLQRMNESAQRARQAAEERLALLRKGKVSIRQRDVDFVVRAPAAGHVIAVEVRAGAPVVPSSSYGSGTVLIIIADLDHPVFRGTVDEIAVGRLRTGMRATVEIGALPNVTLQAAVTEIGLRARRQNNAVVFDIVLDLERAAEEAEMMRSGYSAVARVVVDQRENAVASAGGPCCGPARAPGRSPTG